MRHSPKKRGMALFGILIIMFSLSAMLAITMSASLQRIFTAQTLGDRIRALAIAEAGANEAYAIMATNFALRNNAESFPKTAYADGWYDATVSAIGEQTAVISSTGSYNDVEVEVMLDIKDYGSPGTVDLGYDARAFDYGILCGGEFDFGGCGDISSTSGTTRIHANGYLNVRGDAQADIGLESSYKIRIGNNRTVDGDVTAPILSYKASKVNITGTASQQPVPLVTIPNIDLTPYYNWANDHGEVRSGFSMSGGTYTPNGGILWVNGTVQISSHAVVNGSIIATGDIAISGAADVTSTTCEFAIASRDGDIKNTSTGLIRGLIYTKTGNYDHTANGTTEGQVIIKGDIKKTGCSDVLVYDKSMPLPPTDGGSTPDTTIIGISAWQK